MADFHDRVVVVTGGGSGIGEAAARLLASAGGQVAVVDNKGEAATAVAEAIVAEGGRAIAVVGDVRDETQVDDCCSRVLREWDGLDVLVNCAGISQNFRPTVKQELASWQRVIDVNLKGTYLFCRRAGQAMVERGRGGAIVNIASVVGCAGFPMRTAYGPSKAGVINLTAALAVEWAPHGIRVNAVAPGYILTPMVKAGLAAGNVNEAALRGRTPLGRLGTPEEVAALIAFLAGDDAAYITGVTVPIDGGWLAKGSV